MADTRPSALWTGSALSDLRGAEVTHGSLTDELLGAAIVESSEDALLSKDLDIPASIQRDLIIRQHNIASG